MLDLGLYAPYREKDRAGLSLLDCGGNSFYQVTYPERAYEHFEAIPSVIVASLLFIENRELLETRAATRNPAIEWDRFAKALVDQALKKFLPGHEGGGGSTLATQIEKYRHSPEGRTSSGSEKLRQMATASVRAYLDGENTHAVRRRIVVQYLNTVPLSAKAGYGEVNGLGDGLWAWYGSEFAEINRLLQKESGGNLQLVALAFKQVLSLLIAERRPSDYLGGDARPLGELADSYLRLLADAGVIPKSLRDTALAAQLRFRTDSVEPPPPSFVTRKAATAMRAHLAQLLGVPRLYDLDRLDLRAGTTLAIDQQRTASTALRKVVTQKGAQDAGLFGFRLFSEGDNVSRVIFSLTLFERGDHANYLRIQTDSFDQPFDINEGAKLDLGSTAKLRTLVTYLEIVADLHKRLKDATPAELAKVESDRRDILTRWAVGYLAGAQDRSLAAMLKAAMERSYSGSTAEQFFTGGGLHRFENFETWENAQAFTVRDGFRNSVNLVFIRLMRDIVYHMMFRAPTSSARVLEDAKDPQRQKYLQRFADKEGTEFITRFYRKYEGKRGPDVVAHLLSGMRLTPKRLAVTLRSVEPDAPFEAFHARMRAELGETEQVTERSARALYEAYGPDKYSLPDRGYLAGIHPLELWLVGFLRSHPNAKLKQVIESSSEERQAVYAWLFKTRHKNAQDSRIKGLIELEAFLEIHRAWKRLGYPFESLTPSYATAIGSSADRPAALAELMGIIVNRGVRKPLARLNWLQFGADTPFETRLARAATKPEQVLPEEIADVLREALIAVAEDGTAKRIKGAFKRADGSVIPVGGKTGTGDHRFDVFAPGGRLVSSRVVNRSATFVFLIGERWFGTLTAFVHEPYAEKYKFTSALSVQMLKSLAPSLMALLESPPRADGTCIAGAAGNAAANPAHSARPAAAPVEISTD